MNWRFWKKKEQPAPQPPEPPAEVPAEEPKVWNPRITFELVGGGEVHVVCDWPEPESVEEKVGMAKTFASMLMLLNEGHLFHLMQQAVAVTGRLKGDERLSEHMLSVLNAMQKASAQGGGRGRGGHGRSGGPNRSGPVVPADEVF